MVKVKILSSFVDKYTDEVYKVGDTVDFSVERLEELKQNLSVHDREFFEEVKNTKSKPKKDVEESPDEEIVEDTEE